jgi:hypothetical protein
MYFYTTILNTMSLLSNNLVLSIRELGVDLRFDTFLLTICFLE